MPLKELLVVICLIVTAQAGTHAVTQLYWTYQSSIPGALTDYYIDEKGVIRFGLPKLKYNDTRTTGSMITVE